jgi:hypothetical protein
VRGYVPDEILEEVAAAPVGSDIHAWRRRPRAGTGSTRLVLAVVAVESAFRPAAGVAERCAGADAADARHRARAGRRRPLDPAANLDGGARY